MTKKIFPILLFLSVLAGCTSQEQLPLSREGQATAEVNGKQIYFELKEFTTPTLLPYFLGSFNSKEGDVLNLYVHTATEKPEVNTPYYINFSAQDAEKISLKGKLGYHFDVLSDYKNSSIYNTHLQNNYSSMIWFEDIKTNFFVSGREINSEVIGHIIYTKITDTEAEGKFECTLFSRYVVKEGDTLNLTPKKVKNGKFSVRRK